MALKLAIPGLTVGPLPRWPGWRNLPREARDTLFQLGVIGFTVLQFRTTARRVTYGA